MCGPSMKIRLLGCLTCTALALLIAASGASPQEQQQTNQRQRPRTVGTQGATNTQQPTKSSGEEVSEGDVVRVETQLVTVPAVVTDKVGHPLTGLRAENFPLSPPPP